MDLMIARERLSSVIKPDSITASQGDFLATHVPIKKLHLLNRFDIQPINSDYYSEEDIFNKFILNPFDRHQFISIYGQSGTGKSHLIRWFETRFEQQKPENEVVLFIRRSDNTLKGTIRQLLEKPEVQGIANKEIYERLIRASTYLTENKLKDTIYHNFIIEIHNDDDTRSIKITNVKRKQIEAFLNNEVVHDYLMSEKGPIERMYSKIAEHTFADTDIIAQFVPEDFYVSADLNDSIKRAGADPKVEKMALKLMSDVSGPENAKKLSEYLNQFVNDVIQRCAGIEPGDFRQIFHDIRRELFRLGKNLTLFIEDVTSFTGVDDALLDALIVEHTGMNASDNICRISSIVGTTSNYLQNNFRDNHKDRITQYVYIPSDVFDQAGLYEFIGRYINTMSLPVNTISSWMHNHANPQDYPVHEIKEGVGWKSIPIESGKHLCLYPFTKNSINHFYKHGLTMGHQTPRYIIRDIIEPVVNDILYNKESFPSHKFKFANTNTTLSFLIHNQVPDKIQADRLLRFLSIWGNGLAEQSTIDGMTHISGVAIDIIKELNFPIISLAEKTIPNPRPPVSPADSPIIEPHQRIAANIHARVNKANEILTNWTNNEPIDISANVGTSGLLRAAQADICSYLFSSINWQAEGLSIDNINKVKSSKNSLIMFENQTKGFGFYTLPANWESMNLISAFIRWREYGKQSWDYPDADFDAYIITSWSSKIKEYLIKALNPYVHSAISYIEAAVIAEVYRMILHGEYRENNLKKLSTKYLFGHNDSLSDKSNHSMEWLSMNSLLSQKGADKSNRETIRQYFNITQGEGGSVVILDEPRLSQLIDKVKLSKLAINESDLQLQDTVKLRRDVFVYIKDIIERINSVAKAEKNKAFSIIQQIYTHFDNDQIDEDEILELVDLAKIFYSEVNNTQINIAVTSTEKVKKNSNQIAKAINKIGKALEEDDTLTVLMAFSGDPISDLNPLVDLITALDNDVRRLNTQLIVRNSTLGEIIENSRSFTRYAEELNVIDANITILSGLR